jgi:polyhydroxybutyrate depolymerase
MIFRPTTSILLLSVSASLPAALSIGCSDDPPTDGAGGMSSVGGTNSSGTSGSAGTTGGAPGTGGTAARGGGAGTGTGGTIAGTSGSGNTSGTGTGGSLSGSGGSSGGTGGSAAGASGAGASGGGASGGGAGVAGSGTGGSSGSGTGGSGGGTESAGCGKSPPMSDRYDIDVDGTMREYILALPDDYDPSLPHRLIFGWHPLGGSAQQVAGGGYYGLESQAEGTAIFVAPEGLPFQGNSLGWGNTNGQDLEFLEAMLARFRAELCIDEERIFSTGFSFGGMMSFAVGCAENGVMRAIAPQAGNIQVSGCEDGTRPVAVMGFHGDDDTVVSIDGGRAGRDQFIERNQCSDQTEVVDPSWCDGLGASNQPCECVSYQGCADGYPVIWCEFNGPHTPAPNSGQTIWDFFSSF